MADVPATVGPAIEPRDLSKRFGQVEALQGMTLVVSRGVTFGLLGPNGAGKTTSIRLWLGLTAPSSGSARTLGENLCLFGRLVGLEEPTIRRRTDAVLRFMDIAKRRDDLVSTLSGGIKRRTSLAAALLHNPDLLLLDEPTVGVDPELRASFWSFFHRLTERGKTILITTHYMEEASRCDLVALLHRGRMLACDAPTAIKERTGSANLDDAFLSLVRSARVGT